MAERGRPRVEAQRRRVEGAAPDQQGDIRVKRNVGAPGLFGEAAQVVDRARVRVDGGDRHQAGVCAQGPFQESRVERAEARAISPNRQDRELTGALGEQRAAAREHAGRVARGCNEMRKALCGDSVAAHGARDHCAVRLGGSPNPRYGVAGVVVQVNAWGQRRVGPLWQQFEAVLGGERARERHRGGVRALPVRLGCGGHPRGQRGCAHEGGAVCVEVTDVV